MNKHEQSWFIHFLCLCPLRLAIMLYFNISKVAYSTPGKVACIWHIERVQIDATKFERKQIHFFYRRCVVLAEGSKSVAV